MSVIYIRQDGVSKRDRKSAVNLLALFQRGSVDYSTFAKKGKVNLQKESRRQLVLPGN